MSFPIVGNDFLYAKTSAAFSETEGHLYVWKPGQGRLEIPDGSICLIARSKSYGVLFGIHRLIHREFLDRGLELNIAPRKQFDKLYRVTAPARMIRLYKKMPSMDELALMQKEIWP